MKVLSVCEAIFVPEMDLNPISCSDLWQDGYTVPFGHIGCSASKCGELFLFAL